MIKYILSFFAVTGLLGLNIAQAQVETASFTATAQNRAVTLHWSTIGESNSDHFEIVRNGIVRGLVEVSASGASPHSYSWIDREAQNEMDYEYTLVLVNLDGSQQTLGTVNATPAFDAYAVNEYALHQNYPNPFNPTTTITLDLAEAGFATLKVFNLLGQQVSTLVNQYLPRGSHVALFDGARLQSGVYIYKLDVNEFSAHRKMILMK
jgi:hypothetical protein